MAVAVSTFLSPFCTVASSCLTSLYQIPFLGEEYITRFKLDPSEYPFSNGVRGKGPVTFVPHQ